MMGLIIYYQYMKEIFVLSLLVLACLCIQPEYNIRFKDDEMMRKHHKHENPNADNLTVHLIPHSHDDVGWLKTVDEYYYGSRQSIQWAGVQYTIDTVVSELAGHPEYKFSIVEMAFLYRWWNGADSTQRQQLQDLVKNGQIQFINGGWCMSDQATVHYEDFIDQMTIGLRWLKETFDYVPDVAWHIDPFGHQASSATMFSKMGMQAFFFSRIDYQDKQKRMSERNLEMIWSPKLTTADSTNFVFTQVNYYHYSPPPGFCFDLLCRDEPIKDDETMEDYNILTKSQEFVNYFKSMALHFRSNSLMHTMGEDFHYANAHMWYKNIDKLIKFINSRPQFGVKLLYSTPSAYIKEINSQGIKYQVKTDDFFPYADGQNAYWTGYFTSRVSVKGFVRDLGRWLQAVRKSISENKIRGSDVIAKNSKQLESLLWGLQMAMGILQHHDAVSGTEKQKVADDYIATALKAISKFTPLYRQIVKEQIVSETGDNPSEQAINFNLYWNQTATQTGLGASISANKTVLLSLYNPGTAQKRQIRVSVPNHDLKVESSKNTPITGDVFCASTWDANHCELVFSLDFPESGNAYVKITSDSKGATAKVVKLKELSLIDATKGFNLTSTAYLKVTKSSGKVDLTLGDTTESFTVSYNYYQSYQGEGQKSGAYIFRPASDTPKKFSSTKVIHYAEGNQGVFLVFEGDKVVSKLFFSKTPGYVERRGFIIESRIDSISVSDKVGKEVTLNFNTNYDNNQTFYTDSNGLEQQTRILNFRPTWPLVVNQAVAGNYYPVNSHIGFVDQSSNKKVTILNDRSQGGSVLRTGQIQLMVNRRTLYDDSRGVGEPLSETEPGKPDVGLIQTVRHYVVFGDNYRQVQILNDQKVTIAFAESSSATFAKHNTAQPPIKVPSGVKLYLRPFTDGSYLLRVQNFNLANTNVNLPEGWQATQYTLSANQLQQDWKKKQYKWNTETELQKEKPKIVQYKEKVDILQWIVMKTKQFIGAKSSKSENISKQQSADEIKLDFLQIRTFKIIKS